MNKNLSIACFLGCLAVVIGAFTTHSLKESLTQSAIESIQTAVKYQFYHVFAVLFVNLYAGFSNRLRNRLSFLFFLGILLFSGSIYLIYLLNVSPKLIWFVTPLGGVFFIVGWLWLFVYFLLKTVKKQTN